MARIDFNKDFNSITDEEKFVLESLLSTYELITRQSFFRRWTLRTHRLTRANRLSFYIRAAQAVRQKEVISDAFRILADDAQKIINRCK